eukprot:RCo006788
MFVSVCWGCVTLHEYAVEFAVGLPVLHRLCVGTQTFLSVVIAPRTPPRPSGALLSLIYLSHVSGCALRYPTPTPVLSCGYRLLRIFAPSKRGPPPSISHFLLCFRYALLLCGNTFTPTLPLPTPLTPS